jgi:hypothetical protein
MDIKLLKIILDNLITPSMRDFANTPDLDKNRLRQLRHKDILDSFSPNQFLSKMNLINHVKSLNILDKESEIVIFGSWYGSILVPAFYDDVKLITAIDSDRKVILKSKEMFKDYSKVDFIEGDVFDKRIWHRFKEDDDWDLFKRCNLVINTSCEHMKSMKDWGPSPEYKTPWWKRFENTHFAFQSNAMFDIPTHSNCVNNIEEFKKQLPDNAKVLIEDEIPDERGTRFTLIGKICNE